MALNYSLLCTFYLSVPKAFARGFGSSTQLKASKKWHSYPHNCLGTSRESPPDSQKEDGELGWQGSTVQDTPACSQLPACIDSQLIMGQVKGKAQSCSHITVLSAGKCLQEFRDTLSPPQLRAGTRAHLPPLPPCLQGAAGGQEPVPS